MPTLQFLLPFWLSTAKVRSLYCITFSKKFLKKIKFCPLICIPTLFSKKFSRNADIFFLGLMFLFLIINLDVLLLYHILMFTVRLPSSTHQLYYYVVNLVIIIHFIFKKVIKKESVTPDIRHVKHVTG